MALHQTAKCGNLEAGRTVEGSSLYPNFPHEQPPFPAELLFGTNVSVSSRFSAEVRQLATLSHDCCRTCQINVEPVEAVENE
jgi:hypothetical protein